MHFSKEEYCAQDHIIFSAKSIDSSVRVDSISTISIHITVRMEGGSEETFREDQK